MEKPAIHVEFTPEARDMMRTRNIGADDVIHVLRHAEDHGGALVSEETGILSARGRIKDRVFWVKYTQPDYGRYLVNSAFCHRVNYPDTKT